MKCSVEYTLIILLLAARIAIAQVPTSARSTSAIKRNIPILEEALADMELTLESPIFIRVFKEEHELELWVEGDDGFTLFKIYDICHFSGDLGPKTMQGDMQSPEGFYFVNANRMNPWSSYHLSINVGYPNRYDRGKGYTGDYLMIHGNCVSIGCYAMTDPGIEEIFTLASKTLNNGHSFFRVHIFPFRMTEQNMKNYQGDDWYSFWLNLKTGYDWFEEKGSPPNVEVEGGVYVFEE